MSVSRVLQRHNRGPRCLTRFPPARRSDTLRGEVARLTVLGTIALGTLVAASPVVAFWAFDGVLW
ncbi:hypothetical protein [Halorubrum sp. DTA46]|uniref:hypothetical protein n=1 Tax=Halorubrum sp. DTA46 TaxID=3402162 RepID=UPI003AAB85CD